MCTGDDVISTEYVSPALTLYSVTLVLLVAIGDWSELTLCFITYPTCTSLLVNFKLVHSHNAIITLDYTNLPLNKNCKN